MQAILLEIPPIQIQVPALVVVMIAALLVADGTRRRATRERIIALLRRVSPKLGVLSQTKSRAPRRKK